MVYRLLEERSKKGAGRSMRALACRVCAWVLPLYRNLEPITRKPLGGGSGDTSLEQSSGDEDQGLHCQAQRPQQAFPSSAPPATTLHRPERGDLGGGGAGCADAASCTPEPPQALVSLSSQPGATDSPEECVVLNADLPQPLG